MKFRSYHLILLSLLSGIILAIGWPVRGFPGLLFLGFVPMLIIEDRISSNPEKFYRFNLLFYVYPGFFLWNILTTWWIVNSTFIGASLAIVLNSLFMSIVFQSFHWTKKKLKNDFAGYIALIAYWISFEYLHLNWDLNWPWLNLGNGFAAYYKWVQWYEYTGAMGGTLWTLLANILIFLFLKRNNFEFKKFQVSSFKSFILTGIGFWILFPIGLSYFLYFNYEEKKNPVNVVVVQPNIDPYSEQYNLPPAMVVGKIMQFAQKELNKNVNFLVAPESAIQESMWENDLRSFTSIRLLREILNQYPDLNILVGGSTFYQLHPDDPRPRWARKFVDSDQFYVAYNAAIMINRKDSVQLYHKSKLTPGVEILPSFDGFKWLEKYALDLGGTVGSLGMDDIRKVYHTTCEIKTGPVICYESIFGEFFSEFVKNGAQVMMIITNDGWWGNTAGHRQHYAFAHLRAIETRRSIARSANTGISAFIDQKGDARNVTQYWVPAVIKGTINANDKITFYVRHGDYIARYMTLLAALALLSAIMVSLKKRILKKHG